MMPRTTVQDEQGFNQVFAPIGSTPFRTKRRNEWFLTQIKRLNAGRVLEIGCGTGEAASYFAANSKAEIVAVDISPSFIADARGKHKAANLRFEQLDLMGDRIAALGNFDMICGNGILHHLAPQLPRLLRVLRSLIHKEGGLAFIEPNLLNPYCAFIFGTQFGRRFARLEPEEMAFSRAQLRRAFTQSDWNNVMIETRDFVVPGIPKIFVAPILIVEPVMEATPLTRWLAQSHLITAQA